MNYRNQELGDDIRHKDMYRDTRSCGPTAVTELARTGLSDECVYMYYSMHTGVHTRDGVRHHPAGTRWTR